MPRLQNCTLTTDYSEHPRLGVRDADAGEVRAAFYRAEDRRVFIATPSLIAALEMFENAFASDIEADDEMGGADTVESVCSLWHRFIKPALAEARGEVRTYSRNEDQEG